MFQLLGGFLTGPMADETTGPEPPKHCAGRARMSMVSSESCLKAGQVPKP